MLLKSVLLKALLRQNKLINFSAVVVRNNSYEEYEKGSKKSRKYGKAFTATVLGSVLFGSAYPDKSDGKGRRTRLLKVENVNFEAGEKRPDLPTYRADEVTKHDSKKSFWVIYKHGVYDITEFLPSHPGGDQILNAGGLSIEPFWNVYGVHKTDEVFRLLEQHRIGNLHDEDIADHSDEEMWAREPARDSRLIVKTLRPFNAETPPDCQISNFDTPNEVFYVRQHLPVPELDPCEHRLAVTIKPQGGRVSCTTEFSLEDLQQFPPVTMRATLMCAGNRRSEMDKVRPVKGLSWSGGAIANALWSGVYLRDVLLHCGVDETHVEGKHVIMTGSDIDATGGNFNTSIPLAMALDPGQRVLLATHMNGAPLPPDHGYPLRVVVPGAPAVRSVKWLASITVSESESQSHWHQKDYRSFNPSTTWETADFASAPPVYSLPVTSAICSPRHGDTALVTDGCLQVQGYAYSGGGAKILRVDVSVDGGCTWVEAQKLECDDAPARHHYAWTLWTAYLPVPAGTKETEVWVKATDSDFNTQPENFDDIWNIRGLLSNAYHKIKVQLKHCKAKTIDK